MGAQSALILLLSLTWRESTRCNGLTVDPPDHLVAVDPGHLGLLEITWSPPASWIDVPDCQKLYQLEYFNTYEHSWTAIRTPRESYRAQFDLMKDIRVRVYTLLRGPCTNGTTVKSMNYTELVQKPPSAGVAGTAVKDFVCVYHNMEYMECNWKRSPRIPANSQQRLYFWHKDLEQTEECPKYILSGGVRSGCNFTGRTLPDFTDINFCINGSSAKGLLEPAFTTLQIQNQVKPGTTEKLHLQSRPDGQLEARWERPVGKVPGHCLEWEVEHSQESPDGKITSEQILTEQMNLTLSGTLGNERHCFRVRSKLHKYCVDRAIWSEWSRPTCYPATSTRLHESHRRVPPGRPRDPYHKMKEVEPEPEWDKVPFYVYVAAAIIGMLMLALCMVAVLKRGSRLEKKLDPLLTTLFARNPVLTVVEA